LDERFQEQMPPALQIAVGHLVQAMGGDHMGMLTTLRGFIECIACTSRDVDKDGPQRALFQQLPGGKAVSIEELGVDSSAGNLKGWFVAWLCGDDQKDEIGPWLTTKQLVLDAGGKSVNDMVPEHLVVWFPERLELRHLFHCFALMLAADKRSARLFTREWCERKGGAANRKGQANAGGKAKGTRSVLRKGQGKGNGEGKGKSEGKGNFLPLVGDLVRCRDRGGTWEEGYVTQVRGGAVSVKRHGEDEGDIWGEVEPIVKSKPAAGTQSRPWYASGKPNVHKAGQRLDEWVATRLGLSRSKAKKMLQQGLVTVDGVLETTASRTLQLTNRVEVRKE
jgi:hypothetical protein